MRMSFVVPSLPVGAVSAVRVCYWSWHIAVTADHTLWQSGRGRTSCRASRNVYRFNDVFLFP